MRLEENFKRGLIANTKEILIWCKANKDRPMSDLIYLLESSLALNDMVDKEIEESEK